MTSQEVDDFLRAVWSVVTPPSLVIASVVLWGRLIIARRWPSRMSRATTLVITSYAILMIRAVLGVGVLAGRVPNPWWTSFYAACAVYFAYALWREWGWPFFYWLYCYLRGIDCEPVEELTERLEQYD